jgi:hypothetical protein
VGAYARAVVTHPAQLVLWALAALAVWNLLRAHFWRAWLFVRPGSLRIAEAGAPPQTPALLEKTKMLEALGFKPLGAHREAPRFGPRPVYLDFALENPLVFATLAEHRGRVSLYFVSPCAGGPVLTADHFRPIEKGEAARSAGMPGWAPHRLLRAHQERAARSPPTGPATLDARLSLARAWYAGLGVRELRRVHLSGVVWTLLTFGMVAGAVLR